MAETGQSLDEVLYNYYYEKFEGDRERSGEHSKSLYNVGKNARYFTLAATAIVWFGGNFARKILQNVMQNEKLSRRIFISQSAVTAAAVGLTIHMQEAMEIFGKMYRKNNGEELTKKEVDALKLEGRIGRAAHYVGASGFGIGFTAVATSSRREFLAAIPFFAIAPFWYYRLDKEYGALYNAAVDYTAGERRFEKPATAQK